MINLNYEGRNVGVRLTVVVVVVMDGVGIALVRGIIAHSILNTG